MQDRGWVRTPIDAFILARLEKAGLKSAPPAERATLLRRVTLDLTGLPPTPEELADFLHDSRADAYARVVERLLASPHYGERWAQHWLDVVRYAESDGYEADAPRPDAWRYRDYVIRSLNEDKPYDRFVEEQLAGDELDAQQDPRPRTEMLIATGFNRCGPVHRVAGNTNPEVNRQEVLTEMTGAVGAAFLGLTVACARCHDHKFDPLSQLDYYRLEAFFAATQSTDVDIASAEEKAAYHKQVHELEARLAPLRKQVAEVEEPYRSLLTDIKRALLEERYRQALDIDPKKRTPEQQQQAAHAQVLLKVSWDELLEALSPEERARRAAWKAQIRDLEGHLPPPPAHAWAVHEEATVPPTHVLKRGDVRQKGALVEPGLPEVLDVLLEHHPRRLQRIDLARWLTRPDHPLTARVIANRLWQHHFGRGLVGTPNDFGIHGDRPTHPELLDWLAGELVAHHWSLKHLHRVMVLSNTYQQATRSSAAVQARRIDPDNHLLWHMNRWRLEGEAIRDSVLAVAGTLNPRQGGPMVRVPLEPEVQELIFTEAEPDSVWPITPDPREHVRRSIYLFAKRNLRLPLLEAFDRPDMLTSCPARPVSTFAPQAFILLNGPFVHAQSKAFAARLLNVCGPDMDRQIDLAYRLALARSPRVQEQRAARDFLAGQAELLRQQLHSGKRVGVSAQGAAPVEPAMAAALADLCLALFNCNEFVYVN